MSEIINHDAFRFEGRGVDSDALLRFMVTSFAELHPRLLSEQVIDANFDPYIATVLKIDEDGSPIQSTLYANRRPTKHKFPVKKIFPDCTSPHSRIWIRWRWDAFEFPPGENMSNWIKASDLGMRLMKSNNQEDGVHDPDTWEGFGVTDFAIRLVATPSESVDQVEVLAVALPVPLESLSTLPGGQAKSLPGYPVIGLLKPELAFHAILNLEPVRGDALPALPIALHTLADPPTPDCAMVRESMYAVWRSCVAANHMMAPTWNEVMAGADLDTDPIKARYSWPPAPTLVRARAGSSDENENDDDEEADSGEYLSRF